MTLRKPVHQKVVQQNQAIEDFSEPVRLYPKHPDKSASKKGGGNLWTTYDTGEAQAEFDFGESANK